MPGDISVVGFDDQPEVAYYKPPLTTVRQDFAAVGTSAFHAIDTAMCGAGAPSTLLISPELVVRRSTAPPASR